MTPPPAPRVDLPLGALRDDCAALTEVLRGLAPGQWRLPSPCPPWDVAGLVGHIDVVLGRLPGMLRAPAPARATVTARGYYRDDARFSPATSSTRVDQAQQRAERLGPAALPDALETTWRTVTDLCAAEPAGRLVTTRHGDAMLLSEFIITRVLEVTVHGFDVAIALGREPWLTPAAAEVLLPLFPPHPPHPPPTSNGTTSDAAEHITAGTSADDGAGGAASGDAGRAGAEVVVERSAVGRTRELPVTEAGRTLTHLLEATGRRPMRGGRQRNPEWPFLG